MTDTDSSVSPWEALTTVSISDIVLRSDFQMRFKHDQGIIRRYATAYRQGANMPPLKVAKIGKALVLVDGWHRLAALESLEHSLADVEIIPCTNEREALWLAASANLSHGLPLKAREMIPVFKAYIKAGKHRPYPDVFKSYREIAADLGGIVSYGTIRNWMKRYYPSIARRMSWKDEPPKGDGCPDKRITTMKDTTKEYLEMALAAFRGVESLEERQEILKEAERIVSEMSQEEVRKPWQYDHGDF